MKGNDHQWLARACHRLLRPLVRIMLRHGVAHKDFDAVVRAVYAEVARESFAPAGKRPTDSHVAIVTGLTRKEVKRLREEADGVYDKTGWGGANRATRVLSGWHRDPDFTDAEGAPRRLTLDGDKSEFTQLVRRYSGDIPTVAILDELERVHSVRREPDGTVSVLNRAYVPGVGDPERVRMLGSAAHDLLSTLEHNVSRTGDARPYFQRSVFNTRVDPRVLPVFHRLVSQQAQHLLEVFDDWLERHEIDDDNPQAPASRAGVGIYYFEDAAHPGDKNDEA
ncbi:hypothetical protein J7355_12625 [Endozoicomonas sp. G2_2]|uniref:DUF6502 family protein n=1 Tax=Gammaproteobacteria TaxID=1236 RepID=UPI000C434DD3|nr:MULTISPECIES: DUF6502 family protein [Gammaproteobacteria]MAS10616.1 hypothetical protein [Salinisphaera sp.]MBO9470945.1 hypothetical protein [Endozoicomonas sp. G2_2]